MSEKVLLDNDIALKMASYSLVQELLNTTTVNAIPPSMLGVAKFVINRKIERGDNISDIEAAKAAFEQLVSAVHWLEPDDDEAMFAAQIEAEASRDGLELDVGESLLVAIMIRRSCLLLITGDKRAISALGKSAIDMPEKRLCCLEQLVSHIVILFGLDVIRSKICAEPKVDKAITACFGCSQTLAEVDDVIGGLDSYTRAIGGLAPAMLILNDELAACLA